MHDRVTMLQTIDAAYAARQKGDKESFAAFLAPGATFRLAGTSHLLGGMPVGPADARAAIGSLIDQFHFNEVRRIDGLVDGNRAAVRMAVRVAVAGGGEVATELFDIWTFDAAGNVTDITQFADTAQIAALLPDA